MFVLIIVEFISQEWDCPVQDRGPELLLGEKSNNNLNTNLFPCDLGSNFERRMNFDETKLKTVFL